MFEKDGTGSVTEGDSSVVSFRYEIDYSKRPIWLDLILAQDGKETRIRSIVEFTGKDKMRWRTFFNDSRPIEFLEKDPKHTIVLSRVGA